MGATPRCTPCPVGRRPLNLPGPFNDITGCIGEGGGVEWVHYHPMWTHVLGFEIFLPPPTCS